MKISVVMASFLGEYEGCATDRETKFIRAVNSFINNSYQDKELIIIGDCCSITENVVKNVFAEPLSEGLIKFYDFPKKQKLFSGKIRSKGIEMASGDYIMYLDTDDMYGQNHIKTIVEQIKTQKYDWAYFNDFMYGDSGLATKYVEVKKDSIGTSSIVHKKSPSVNWDGCDGYGHDFKFIQRLLDWSKNYSKLYGASYIICHIPNIIDK